jgi:UDP-galactopyranose mutase
VVIVIQDTMNKVPRNGYGEHVERMIDHEKKTNDVALATDVDLLFTCAGKLWVEK